jgi:hypothetical protein
MRGKAGSRAALPSIALSQKNHAPVWRRIVCHDVVFPLAHRIPADILYLK